jgi:pyruvate/2-oxoglutarate/acetoin dehydrogenase E1 component
MGFTLREQIRETTREHLSKGNQLFGQCLTAVGWVGGTVPELTEEEGLVELPMADVMAGGIVVGSALAGKRPIYLVRYQGFQWYNSPIITNYAGKTKEMWNVPCPIFIRSIAMEGGIGPVAGSSHHGIYYRMPGITIASPMTPNEYIEVYNHYMNNDDTIYVSEHRGSYDVDFDLPDINESRYPDIVLFPFCITRINALEAATELNKQNKKVSLFNQLWINPLQVSDEQVKVLAASRYGGIVLDNDYPNGVAKQIAYELMHRSGKPVYVLCIKERVAGFQPWNDNLPPTKEEIITYINKITK